MKTKEIKEQLERAYELINDAESIIDLKSHYQELLNQEKVKDKREKSYGQLHEKRYQKEINRCVKNLEKISDKIKKFPNQMLNLI